MQALDKHGVPFEIRRYAPADRCALEAMYGEFEPKRAAQGLPPGDARATALWLDRVLPSGTHLLAIVDGRVRGHAMLIPMGEWTLELANFVHQTVRDRGIGTALNQAAVDVAREQGAHRVWLSVEPSNRAALRSYRRAGFEQLGGSTWAQEIEMAVDLTKRPSVDGA